MVTILRTPAAWPRILLARADVRDPTDLDAAVADGAFEGLQRAVRDLGGAGTIAFISASGLRGRGGAGYPTGDKWRTAATTEADKRYVVANGYGADPASHTDRALMLRDPYAVIEGTAIAATAIGATEAFIAVRGEDAEVIAALSTAIGHASDAGFLGDDILASGRDLWLVGPPRAGCLHARRGDGPPEGARGQARPARAAAAAPGRASACSIDRPSSTTSRPWPPCRGSCAQGPDAFRATGSTHAPGTVLVQIRTPGKDGVAEVPLGTPLREVAQARREAAGRALDPGGPHRRAVGRAVATRCARHAI